MVPVLIDISDTFKIYSFGTFIVLAFLVSSFYVRRRAANDARSDARRRRRERTSATPESAGGPSAESYR